MLDQPDSPSDLFGVEDSSTGDLEDDADELIFLTPEPALTPAVQQAVYDTYRKCWTQFYEDEQAFCLQALSFCDIDSDPEPYSISDEARVPPGNVFGYSLEYTVTDLRPDNSITKQTVGGERVMLYGISPGPRYSACTPADSYLYNDKPRTKTTLEFIRYGGVRTPAFDERAYMKLFPIVHWQTPFQDPDYYLIAHETIRRLTSPSQNDDNVLKVSVEDVAALGIFPSPNMAESNYARLLDIQHRARHRDAWSWTGAQYPLDFQTSPAHRSRSTSPLRESDNDTQQGSTSRLSLISQSFCAYLHCLRASCGVHPYVTGWNQESTVAPQLSNAELQDFGRAPCGENCYKYVTDDCSIANISTEELDVIESCFALEPDEFPCTIATLLRGVSCQQVYTLRCRRIPDNALMGPPRRTKLPKTFDFKDEANGGVDGGLLFLPQQPCNCRGPCYLQPDCICYSESLHCQRNCQCNNDCVLRYKGCKCHARQRKRTRRCRAEAQGYQDECRCQKAGRECDPERCIDHRTISASNTRIASAQYCRNFDLQLQKYPRIEVKTGAYGFGGFATTNLQKNTFIGDYMAEKFWANARSLHEKIADFAHLNYTFQLNREETLDAFSVGNETRFFNDPGDESASNVTAYNKYINGNQHIAFYTTKYVRKGEELLFSYGTAYWAGSTQKAQKVREESAQLGLEDDFEDDLLFE